MTEDGAEEENASMLMFPKEFEASETLLISEVRLLLEDKKQRSEEADEDTEFNEVFNKTLSYCQTFSKYSTKENMQAVRQLLTMQPSQPLHKFELAQLGNLVPDSAEDARALIPSIQHKLTDEELEQLLDDLKAHVQSQVYQ